MSLRLLSVSAAALFLAVCASPAAAQDAAVEAQAVVIRDQAMRSNIALDYVTQVTTRFGALPAGSRAEQQAAAWAADYMRAHGFQNVRIEEFPLVGWERGQSSGEVLGAHPQVLALAALGHSPATPRGGIEGEVVRFTSLEDLQAAPEGSLRGKIAYVDFGQMRPMQDGSGYGPQTRVRGAGPGVAAAKGAAAFILRSVGSDENRLPHTGTTQYVDGKPTIPSFALAAPDADQVSRLVAMGEPVRLRLTSTARTYETHSQNVIGDLPGAARPDEVIVLGSHMDSWDLGTGAIDDAAGGAITLAAAKAIADSGRRPARTIRVVLYGSEEVAQPTRETGNGGGVYARNQGAALDTHIIAGESDFGADRVYALRLPAGAQGSDFQKAANRVLYPIGVLASRQVETEGGVDIGPMGPLGVPFFGLAQDGTRYFDLHHTANDTLDKIDPAQLTQNVAAWAALVWLIADSDVDFRAMRPADASPDAAH
ncbi:MAG: peptidase M20 [Brevundimonas sp.]|uniref:Carboxypeptidase Q n=1 Tax=Brevundimonas albigilva TaxID=1312364 RepID=A0ABY4SQ74_9CAUL|nr:MULTISPECIES: M20/M25/M40 family metallo-hydrolase [Brevundimonas]PZU59997.1 MAG: peptidase M20 [Brevundimonas sp.]UQV19083.1 M20/M25/M40 family metallo-hydrolase [Brevundimonas albigilva]URI16054.1 M20/M25/M40 family metallo-hydrolase [Brevundimonas albigilva]